MAYVKKSNEIKDVNLENSDIPSVIKEENFNVDNEKKELLNTVENQKNQINDMFKQMQDMQKLLISLQSNSNNVSADDSNFESVGIGCRLIGDCAIYSPKREIEVVIPYGEGREVEFTHSEIQMLIKTPFVKEFLRKGVLYFTNEDAYEKYKIFNRFDLSDEMLAEMLISKSVNIKAKLNELTKDKRDDPVVHSLFYRIVKLSMEGKLSKMSYETRKEIEAYFKFTIDNGQMLLASVEKVK